MKSITKPSKRRAHGFSLLELMVAVAILGTVVAVAVEAGNQLVWTNNNVSNNIDLVQQGRQFMDQISNDIHMAGFPNYKVFDQSLSPVASKYAGTYNVSEYSDSKASGLIAATANSLQFEGDVDNSGTVSDVFLRLCAGTNPGTTCTTPTDNSQCPCTMQRGTVPKVSLSSGPSYYTELSGVMNTNVFTFFNYDGTQITDLTDTTSLVNIRAVRIQLQVRSSRKDIANGSYAVASLDSEAKLSN